MSRRDRWMLFSMATFGLLLCLGGVAAFFLTMINNTLPWYHAATAPEHYRAVGRSYGQGFTIGFFLCLSLALVAVSLAAKAGDRASEASEETAGDRESSFAFRAVAASPILARRQ